MTHPAWSSSTPLEAPAGARPLHRTIVFSLWVTLSCFAAVVLAEQTPVADVDPACTADYPWRETVARLQPTTAHVCDPHDLPCWQREMDGLESLLAEHPDDLNLRLTYQTLHEHWPGPDRPRREKLRRETTEALEAHPDDPRVRYLQARALPPREALPGVEAAASALPESPWPHLDLAIFKSLVAESQSPSLADPHLQAFLERCPHPPAWTLMLGHIGMGSKNLWRAHLPRLRQVVAHMPPFERLLGFNHLWALEGRVLPLEAQAEQRGRPLADLATLEDDGFEDTGLADTAAYWVRRREAHSRAEDAAGIQEASRQLVERFPCSALGIHARDLLWDQEHGGLLNQVRVASLRGQEVPQSPDLYAATGEWLEACGDGSGAAVETAQLRFFAALGLSPQSRTSTASPGDTVPLSETALVADAKRWIGLWEAYRDVSDSRVPHSRVARALLDRGLEPTWAAALLDEYRQILQQERVNNLDYELLPPELQAQRQTSQQVQDLALDLDRLEAATAVGQLDTALELARQVGPALEDTQAATQTPETRRLRQWVGSLEIRFFELRSALATALEQPLDAVAFTLRAEGLRDARGDTVDETLPASLVAWRQQGGTDAGWQALKAAVVTALDVASLGGPIADDEGWETLDRPLVEFDLEDTKGRRWQRSDLLGRTVLLNVWATWCAPCVEELPIIERLHQRFADHPDVLVLTLNVDREIGRVGPFLARNELTVPALLASDLFDRMTSTSESAVPQIWLTDASGIVRQRQQGYEAGDAQAFEEALAQRLEALAATN